ncbi:hypothetical protein CAEBREN_31225 [Caenorhabditis brenneri]|uniref:Seven TM Receptor n=1 Tax=Caenorhabditis brenneri TaxID=135651 RepID=G0MTQ4_CAEBE|nr:hypothetical protein CAEBREN_31225 [Caenorhabditis brenneri]
MHISKKAMNIIPSNNLELVVYTDRLSSQFTRDLNSVMKEFGLKVEENLYIAPYFYEKNSNGTVSIYYPSFISIIVDSMIINVSIFTACFFGFKCYSTLKTSEDLSTSQNFRILQTQFVYSLVAQTLIPIFMMHIPAFSMFVFTFLNVDVGPLSGIVTIAIALFPAVDPLPTLFIVKNYRRAIQLYISSILHKIAKMLESSDTGTSQNQSRVVPRTV